ncbi:MAG: hypothetical protein FJ004_03415 [Chloroflexi bacterium]|nr:hypothetical protein [Chloroflexota bacterium]
MPGQRVERIAIFVIDGPYSNITLSRLVEHYREKVVLVCNSRRRKGKRISFWHRVKDAYRKRGICFITYPTFSRSYYKAFIQIGAAVNRLLGRPKKVYSLEQILRRYGAKLIHTSNVNSQEIIQVLRQAGPDLIITACFDQLIGKDVLRVPGVAAINIHPGLLPDYRGPAPTFWALLHGENQVGVTVHLIDETFDTGAILKQRAIETPKKKSIFAMNYQLMKIGAELAIEAVAEVETGTCKAVKQQGGRYFSYPGLDDIWKAKKKGIRPYSFSDFVRCFI